MQRKKLSQKVENFLEGQFRDADDAAAIYGDVLYSKLENLEHVLQFSFFHALNRNHFEVIPNLLEEIGATQRTESFCMALKQVEELLNLLKDMASRSDYIPPLEEINNRQRAFSDLSIECSACSVLLGNNRKKLQKRLDDGLLPEVSVTVDAKPVSPIEKRIFLGELIDRMGGAADGYRYIQSVYQREVQHLIQRQMDAIGKN